jgi:glucose dehydrogenase
MKNLSENPSTSIQPPPRDPILMVAALVLATVAIVGLVSVALVTAAALSAPTRKEHSAIELDWPTYNKGYDGRRYSRLVQIDTRTAATLKRVCVRRLGDDGPFQSGPVVVNDTAYVTTAHTIVALFASTCELRLQPVYQPVKDEVHAINRGVAVHSETGHVVLQQTLAAGNAGGIVTYAAEGRQYIAVTSGNLSRSTFGEGGSPERVIYGLGLAADQPRLVTLR